MHFADYYRFEMYAKSAERQAIKGAFLTSVSVGLSFLFGLGMFGAAFW